jgi:hypothetical protein
LNLASGGITVVCRPDIEEILDTIRVLLNGSRALLGEDLFKGLGDITTAHLLEHHRNIIVQELVIGNPLEGVDGVEVVC